MKTIEDIKTAMSTENYRNTYGFSQQLGTPEGVQEQFDNLSTFPGNITYLDLAILPEVGSVTELVTVTVDSDGNIVDRPSERQFLTKEDTDNAVRI